MHHVSVSIASIVCSLFENVQKALVGTMSVVIGSHRLAEWHGRREQLAALLFTAALHFFHLSVQPLHRQLVGLGGGKSGDGSPARLQLLLHSVYCHLAL